jgi:hypothetical protein
MKITELNQVNYITPEFQKKLTEYIRVAGEQIRKRHSRTRTGRVKHSRKDAKPVLEEYDYCYHTGIRFIDAETPHPNPNDPRKRSLDHKKPLVVCFIEGLSMDEANHPDNLCWCLKCVNNVRSSTDIESFKVIAEYYREQFIKEGIAYQ